jgi:HK97 family phage major capsid protein
MSAEIKQQLDELGKAWEQFKSNNEDQIKAAARGVSASIFEEKAVKLNDRISEITKALEESQRAHDELAAKFARPGEGRAADAIDEHTKAFIQWARKGDGKLTADQIKSMSVGSNENGGYLVPVDASGRIAAKIYETSNIRAIAQVDSTTSDAVEGLNDNDEVSTGWTSETGTRSETDTPEIGKWRIEVHEQYAEPRITQKLLDDAALDVGAWLERKIADKFSRSENSSFVIGNGIGKPRGITSYTTAATADSSRAWGVMEHVLSGASADFTSTTPSDKLLELVYSLKAEYRNGARWLTNRAVLLKIRKFKESTTNAYIWQPGLQNGQPALVCGFPVTEAEDMPALAADSLSLAFGNFRVGYQIFDRKGLSVIRDAVTTKGYVKFYTTKRVGGGVVNYEAIKFMKFNS